MAETASGDARDKDYRTKQLDRLENIPNPNNKPESPEQKDFHTKTLALFMKHPDSLVGKEKTECLVGSASDIYAQTKKLINPKLQNSPQLNADLDKAFSAFKNQAEQLNKDGRDGGRGLQMAINEFVAKIGEINGKAQAPQATTETERMKRNSATEKAERDALTRFKEGMEKASSSLAMSAVDKREALAKAQKAENRQTTNNLEIAFKNLFFGTSPNSPSKSPDKKV